MPEFPLSFAAFAATELQFCPHALKPRLLRVLKLLRLSQIHHGIKDHLHTTSPSIYFSPAPLHSSSSTVVLLTFKHFGLERFYFVSVLNLSNSSCRALYAPSAVSPAFVPQQRPTLVMLADKHTRNFCSFPAPSDHEARGVLAQDTLGRIPLCPVPSSIDLSTPLLGHYPMVTSLLDPSGVIIRPMKDGNGKRTFKLGPIVTNGIQTPDLPHEQTLQQPTPGPSGTRWSEELFREPSRTKEPPIPGPSPSSQPPEDNTTCEPEPEVAPMQSTEEPFACPATPRSIIIINDTPVGSPPPPVQSPSHSHNDACQEFTDLRPTLMIP
ncbi:hypothetical protein O181_093870 [Austropuccinia psidii MF-1]|uniref:Uncharacterized protein n=1 Tax=Austropuccinia psidii MF-1 TaxID=1389203 RepID=A0A9Q3J2J3_9BASI|nr:hypothetical protein [Austropuccinia psidii MF-1]